MKILFLTCGPPVVASSRTRVFQYLPFFQREGIKYKVIINSTVLSNHLRQVCHYNSFVIKVIRFWLINLIRACDEIFSSFQLVRFTVLAFFYDIIFIQKVLIPNFVLKLLAQIFKRKIVFDFDDAIYDHLKFYKKRRFHQQLPIYNLLVVENTFTKEYVSRFTNSDILIITGPIDCKRYYPRCSVERGEVIVGWIGSPATQKYLTMFGGVFERLSRAYKNSTFEFVGAQKMNFNAERFRQKEWSLDTEVGDLQNFDIGIMPLPDNEWTRGKGGYKLLQYMAVGIPYVASPVGINKELIRNGENGFLATTEKEWYEMISLLIENPELRKDMGIKGRSYVVENYSFKVAAPKLISALKRLVGEPEKRHDGKIPTNGIKL
ncbi:MAG: glycosyltransferase family 4 protein [bacterium]|nr:MAG: glycosyltransferase family 4 protein [bacterium]